MLMWNANFDTVNMENNKRKRIHTGKKYSLNANSSSCHVHLTFAVNFGYVREKNSGRPGLWD